LRIRWIGLTALLLLTLVSASQSVVAAPEQNSSNNVTSPSANTTSPSAVEFVSVQGIWDVSLAGTEITMAVNQSGDSILGRCKFEGAEPWNGVVAGSISGKMATIALAAMEGKVLVSTEMIGIVSGDALKGTYVSYDSNGDQAQGDLSATKINPDVSGYTPAEITVQAPATTNATAQQPKTVQQNPTIVGQQLSTTSSQQSQTQKSRVKDVTELAKGIDPNIMPRHAPL
jgi:hypothetical protein